MEDEEHQRLDKVMSGLQARDEVAQKAESVTKLQVSAFHCKTCNYLLVSPLSPPPSSLAIQKNACKKLCNSHHFSDSPPS